MKVPVLEEIKFLSYDYDKLLEAIVSTQIGKSPCYIDINDLNEVNTLATIKNFEQALKILNIHPLAPYPLYLISSKDIQSKEVPLIKSQDRLPDYFQKKITRLKQKEISLNSKNLILAKKISNQDLYEKFDDLNSSNESQRELYQVSHELYFLDQILEGLT